MNKLMKIRLKGTLDLDLTKLGLKTGDEVIASPDKLSKVGALNFVKMHNGFSVDCVVWPENYDILNI